MLGALRAAGDEQGAAMLLGIPPGQVRRIAAEGSAPPQARGRRFHAGPAYVDPLCDEGLVDWARRVRGGRRP